MSEPKMEVHKLSGRALETARMIHTTSTSVQKQMNDMQIAQQKVADNGQAEVRALVGAMFSFMGLDPEESRHRLERLDLSYIDTIGDAYVVLHPVVQDNSGAGEPQALS